MRDLYKMKEVYIYQTWYSDDLFELDNIHRDRYMFQLGTDCSWTNFRTKETVNIWDSCMRKITEQEGIQIIREYNLSQLGI